MPSTHQPGSTRLDGRTVIITGAASGIGRGVAVRAAGEGAHVVCVDLQDCEATSVADIRQQGGSVESVVMDIRDAAAWDTLLDRVSAPGPVYGLANIAGIVNRRGPDTVMELVEEHWDEMVATNLTGVWLGMRAVLPGMIAQREGRILNISSMAALRGKTNLASYSAAKGGVAALTRQAAIEYADHGVLVNAIAPGTVDTPILEGTTQEMQEASAQAHAIKRLGKPSDIAAMALHFLDPEHGSWLTGQVMPVDGGWHAT